MSAMSDDAFVRLFQERFDLKVDGVPGRNTLAKLDEVRPPKAAAAPLPSAPAAAPSVDSLTVKVALELIEHEAIVQEWYRDSVNVGTWSVGVTNASGHTVERYKDNPQPIKRCLEIYIWLLQTSYIPAVARAFAGHKLTEAQFAAALSFHYNTGAIEKAQWVKHWKAGRVEEAKAAIMDWRSPPEIVERREKERDLFFDGKWVQDGINIVYPVSKPSYRPNFRAGRHVDVRADVEALLA